MTNRTFLSASSVRRACRRDRASRARVECTGLTGVLFWLAPRSGATVGAGVGATRRPLFARASAPRGIGRCDDRLTGQTSCCDEGREAIEGRQDYERALDRFNKLAELKEQSHGRRPVLEGLQPVEARPPRRSVERRWLNCMQQFKDSKWHERREGAGVRGHPAGVQARRIAPESQNDEELQARELRGLMNSDPGARASRIIEQMLAGANSPKVKRPRAVRPQPEPARRARARSSATSREGRVEPPICSSARFTISASWAAATTVEVLADVYRARPTDVVKRAIIRSFMVSGDRARLLSLAKTETTPRAPRRGHGAAQLGVMGAHAEIAELARRKHRSTSRSASSRRCFVGGSSDKLIELAQEREGSAAAANGRSQLSGLMGASQHRRRHQGHLSAPTHRPRSARKRSTRFPAEQRPRARRSLRGPRRIQQMKKEMVAKMSDHVQVEGSDRLPCWSC